MEVSNTFFITFAVYCIIASFLPVLAIGFVLRGGFIMSWMKVKASRGKLILVRCMNVVQDYYSVGEVKEGLLKYKDKEKEERSLSAQNTYLYDSFGVKCIDVDDEKNIVVERVDMKFISTYDAKKADALISRILMMKPMLDTMTKIMVALLVLILVLSLAAAYLGFKNHDILLKLGTAAVASTTGGVV